MYTPAWLKLCFLALHPKSKPKSYVVFDKWRTTALTANLQLAVMYRVNSSLLCSNLPCGKLYRLQVRVSFPPKSTRLLGDPIIACLTKFLLPCISSISQTQELQRVLALAFRQITLSPAGMPLAVAYGVNSSLLCSNLPCGKLFRLQVRVSFPPKSTRLFGDPIISCLVIPLSSRSLSKIQAQEFCLGFGFGF